MKVTVRPRTLVFDMDGTIADLYAVNDWLPKLRAEDPSPYEEAKPMFDMVELAKVLNELRAVGVEVQVVTWLSKNSSTAYKKAVAEAKRKWLMEQNFPFDKFHAVQYGATKADSIRRGFPKGAEAVLFDDSEAVRKGWHMGRAIDPTVFDIIEWLKELL